MRLLILTLFVAITPLTVMAAEIVPSYPSITGGNCILWENIATGDTTKSAVWDRGNKGTVEVNGTLGNADLEVYYSRNRGSEISVDSDSAPDGLRFSSANGLGFTNIELAEGFFSVNFNSAGTSAQSLDISICAIPK